MPLGRPPPDLSRFPTTIGHGSGFGPLYRIFTHRDPATGRRRSPFFFASAGNDRYDLPAPHGTCYLARSPIGAFLEVFRDALFVDEADLNRRRLCVTRFPRRARLANLLDRSARAFGVTGEIHTTGDSSTTQAWARGLFAAGFKGLRGKIRHDPTLTEQSVSLFDEAGEHLPFGWRWRIDLEELRRSLIDAVAPYGYRVLPPPYHPPADDHPG